MARNDQLIDDAGIRENITLASNVGAAGNQPQNTVYGGNYVIVATATNWNSATAQFQTLGPDGSTWLNLGAAKTANDASGGTSVVLGSNSIVRISVTGTPTGLYVALARVPS